MKGEENFEVLKSMQNFSETVEPSGLVFYLEVFEMRLRVKQNFRVLEYRIEEIVGRWGLFCIRVFQQRVGEQEK